MPCSHSGSIKSESQGLMISKYMQVLAFEKVTKMPNAKVTCRNLLCKISVLLISHLQYRREDGGRLPTGNIYLRRDRKRYASCFADEPKWCIRNGVVQHRSISGYTFGVQKPLCLLQADRLGAGRLVHTSEETFVGNLVTLRIPTVKNIRI